MHRLTDSLGNNEFKYVAAIWWVTWNTRNKLIFERRRPDPIFLAAKVRAVMDAYKKVQRKPKEFKIDSQTSKQHKCKPPPFNHFKINVDVVVLNDKQKGGLGAVIRNSSGKVIAAAIKNTFFHGNVSFLEAQAIE